MKEDIECFEGAPKLTFLSKISISVEESFTKAVKAHNSNKENTNFMLWELMSIDINYPEQM